MRLIDVSTRKFPNTFTKVDDEDFERLGRLSWYPQDFGKKLYVCRQERAASGKQVLVLLHRLLTGAQKGQLVDHIDGDPLNNTRANLRICNNTQNSWNTGNRRGKYKGTTLLKYGKWQATITANGKPKYLGVFESEEAAALAYNEAAKVLHGEFARLNVIKETQ